MRTSLRYTILFIILLLSYATPCISDGSKGDASIALLSEFTYHAGKMDSPEKSRALAAFEARKKAVVLAAKHFMQRGFLKNYAKQEPEIFCLAANKINARIIKETYSEKEKQYSISIRAEVDISNFMEAEIENQVLEKEESDFPWKEEMEQDVSKPIDPGRELSRAYRYIRKNEIRIAIIYLDHLAKKYTNWGDVFHIRALGFQRMNYFDQMMKDLEKACSLNNQEACNELHALK